MLRGVRRDWNSRIPVVFVVRFTSSAPQGSTRGRLESLGKVEALGRVESCILRYCSLARLSKIFRSLTGIEAGFSASSLRPIQYGITRVSSQYVALSEPGWPIRAGDSGFCSVRLLHVIGC